MWICEISGIWRGEDDIFKLLGFYACYLFSDILTPLCASSSRTAVCLIFENGTDELSRNVGKQRIRCVTYQKSEDRRKYDADILVLGIVESCCEYGNELNCKMKLFFV